MRAQLVIASLAALGLLAGGCGSSASKATGARSEEPVTLTLANPNAGDADVGAWMKAVERLSEGSIRIELRSDWRADEAQAERGTLADVHAGKVDIAKIAARAWDTLGVTSFQALHAPFLVDSLELERRVLTGPLGAEMLAGVRDAGCRACGRASRAVAVPARDLARSGRSGRLPQRADRVAAVGAWRRRPSPRSAAATSRSPPGPISPSWTASMRVSPISTGSVTTRSRAA